MRDQRRATFFLDEIQVVPGWEVFARGLLDSEKVDLYLSGSSARLLSCEVATSMRGRAMEAVVQPSAFAKLASCRARSAKIVRIPAKSRAIFAG